MNNADDNTCTDSFSPETKFFLIGLLLWIFFVGLGYIALHQTPSLGFLIAPYFWTTTIGFALFLISYVVERATSSASASFASIGFGMLGLFLGMICLQIVSLCTLSVADPELVTIAVACAHMMYLLYYSKKVAKTIWKANVKQRRINIESGIFHKNKPLKSDGYLITIKSMGLEVLPLLLIETGIVAVYYSPDSDGRFLTILVASSLATVIISAITISTNMFFMIKTLAWQIKNRKIMKVVED